VTDQTSTPAPGAAAPAPDPAGAPRWDAPPAAPGPTPAGAGHSAPPVFHSAAFVLVLLGVFGVAAVVPLANAFFGDRLALASPLATGLTAASGALFAAILGGLAGRVGRRMAFYEVTAACLLWVVFAAAVLTVPPLRAAPVLQPLMAQGTLVAALALAGLGSLAGIAATIGASLAFLLAGSGQVDLGFSYERFVARSHLKLSPRTLAALFAFVVVGVVTGVVPGMILGVIVALVWSFVRDVHERRAYRRGELVARQRMPATLLMTLISISGVAIGVWALTVVLSVMSGFEADLKSKILGHTADGMVLSYGEEDFGDWRAVRKKALEVPGVTGATPFLYNEVMVSSGQNLTGAILKGIDVATIGTVTDLPGSVQDGNLAWLADPGAIPAGGRAAPGKGEDPAARRSAAPGKLLPGILVGRELAHALRVFVGDQVNVVSPMGDLGPAGPQPKARVFRVAGIFYSGMYEYDSKFAYIDLAEGQRFFGSETVTGLELKVKDVDAARGVMGRVLFALGGWPYRAKDWGELNRSLFSALQMEKVAMAVILGFIVLVATFTILSTLIMLVLEKRQEIAVLKSMGAGVPSVMKIFVLEGLAIGATGTLFGLLLGLGTCLLIDKVGIPLDPEIYYINNLPVVIDPSQFALVAVAALVLSYLATLFPATKAARLNPVDGLRSE
jgi:lipoprotein-releasing system permease protein